jgi:energy-coupling factor transporter ATP-binding protein EcfA2
MKIREIRVQNFRNFGPELRSVKFYDEATGLVRPISVLVGSNGCGKTTLLELTVSLLESAAKIAPRRDDNGDVLVVLASGIGPWALDGTERPGVRGVTGGGEGRRPGRVRGRRRIRAGTAAVDRSQRRWPHR